MSDCMYTSHSSRNFRGTRRCHISKKNRALFFCLCLQYLKWIQLQSLHTVPLPTTRALWPHARHLQEMAAQLLPKGKMMPRRYRCRQCLWLLELFFQQSVLDNSWTQVTFKVFHLAVQSFMDLSSTSLSLSGTASHNRFTQLNDV